MSIHGSVRRLGLVVAAMTVLALAAGPVAAGGVTQVDGLQVPDTEGVCDSPSPFGTYVVTGDLTGCWYIDTFEIANESAAGGLVASGTETFVGCLGSTRCGRFFTEFTFTAKFVDGIETHGRCHHPIVGGEGGFAGVRGVIQMHDLPNGCAVYNGHLSN